MLTWFSRYKRCTALLAAGYSLLVIAGHGAASDVADGLTSRLGREVFNGLITASLLVSVMIGCLCLRRQLPAIRRQPRAMLFALVTFLLALAAYNVLLVTNVESIHFLQYALIAVLLFALTGNYGATVLWTTLVGAVDETWQYLGLYGDHPGVYYDFNDIILNLIGAGIGVTLLYLLQGTGSADSGPVPQANGRRHHPVLFLPTVVGLLLGLTILAGLVQVYPAAAAEAHGALLLSRVPAPEGFWTHLAWGKSYHVLSPFEGLLLVQGLLLFYGMMDRGRDPEPGSWHVARGMSKPG